MLENTLEDKPKLKTIPITFDKSHLVTIGEFGIGKFASLSASRRFEVSTRKDDFAATVIFDKDDWNQNKTCWELPLHYDNPHIWKTNGTRVTLTKLTPRQAFERQSRLLTDALVEK